MWDINGKVYVGSGLRSVTLWHAFLRVGEAASTALRDGANFLRPSLLEVECAEQPIALVETADMAKFTKDGSTARTAALTLCSGVTWDGISSRRATPLLLVLRTGT